jgi:adenosylcobinamide hydrolase
MELQTWHRREGGRDLPSLVVTWPVPARVASTSPLGGGIGRRLWLLNAQVASGYARRDPARHLRELGAGAGLAGPGVGMMTAADVGRAQRGVDDDVEVVATVGVGCPTLAAAPPDPAMAPLVGTINIVVSVPATLSDAALVNAVATATEAKAQALFEAGLQATGTPTDAVCVACVEGGPVEDYGGPRSRWGAPLARAVHAAVLGGLDR